MKLVTALGLALVGSTLFLAGSAGGAHADCYTTAEPEVDTGHTGAGHYYVDVDTAVWIDMWLYPWVWVYEETNGIQGLQRDDEHRSDVADCHGLSSDRLIGIGF